MSIAYKVALMIVGGKHDGCYYDYREIKDQELLVKVLLLDPKNKPYGIWLNPTKVLKGHLKVDFDIPQFVFVDLDFKTDQQIESLKNDCGYTPTELYEKIKNDMYVDIAGRSKSGKGIRLIFQVDSVYEIEGNQIKEPYEIHEENFDLVYQYLNDKYGLLFHDKKEIDYYDTCSRRISQPTHPCKTVEINKNKKNNLFNDGMSRAFKKKYEGSVEIDADATADLNDETMLKLYNFIDCGVIDINDLKSIFSSYDPAVVSVAHFGNETTRKVIYYLYRRLYKEGGSFKALSSYDDFIDAVDGSRFEYTINILPLLRKNKIRI